MERKIIYKWEVNESQEIDIKATYFGTTDKNPKSCDFNNQSKFLSKCLENNKSIKIIISRLDFINYKRNKRPKKQQNNSLKESISDKI